jgi:hypothetical protein
MKDIDLLEGLTPKEAAAIQRIWDREVEAAETVEAAGSSSLPSS